MQKYGAKGLAIFQVNNDGTPKSTQFNPSPPTTKQLASWVSYNNAAGASGIDPTRRITKYYYAGPGTKIGIPYNFIIEAKTRKILEKAVSRAALEDRIKYYLNT